MKKIVLIVSGILLALAIPITIFLVKNQQDIRTKAAPATTYTLSPTSLTKSVDETFTLDATIDTGTNQVFVTEIHISYNPAVLEAISITNGPMFPNIIISGKIDPTGKISITLGAENQSNLVTGTGVAAIVKFKAIGETTAPTTVQFVSPDTFAGASGEGGNNVIIGTVPAKIIITGTENQTADAGAQTLSPTPTQGASLSPTPTQGAALTPTPTTQQNAATSSGTISITSPSDSVPITTTRPLFNGTAPTNASVTLVIHPSSQTVSVRANANGVWSYTPVSPLDVGPHEITATAVSPTTQETLTATRTFVIAAATGEGTQDGTPVSGNVSTTILYLSLGILLLVGGILYPNIRRVR